MSSVFHWPVKGRVGHNSVAVNHLLFKAQQGVGTVFRHYYVALPKTDLLLVLEEP